VVLPLEGVEGLEEGGVGGGGVREAEDRQLGPRAQQRGEGGGRGRRLAPWEKGRAAVGMGTTPPATETEKATHLLAGKL